MIPFSKERIAAAGKHCVHGYGGNFGQVGIYYAGDTAAFNEEILSLGKDDPLPGAGYETKVVVLHLGQLLTGRAHEAEDADPYDVLMTRDGNGGQSFAENESSPMISSTSDFPFGDKTYKKFRAALDDFAALPRTKIEKYSDVKPVILRPWPRACCG